MWKKRKARDVWIEIVATKSKLDDLVEEYEDLAIEDDADDDYVPEFNRVRRVNGKHRRRRGGHLSRKSTRLSSMTWSKNMRTLSSRTMAMTTTTTMSTTMTTTLTTTTLTL